MFEQDVVWPRFAAAVDQRELEVIGRRLESAKKVAPTRPHPNTPSDSLTQKTMGMGAAIVDRVRDVATGREADNPPDPQIH